MYIISISEHFGVEVFNFFLSDLRPRELSYDRVTRRKTSILFCLGQVNKKYA